MASEKRLYKTKEIQDVLEKELAVLKIKVPFEVRMISK